MRIKTAKIETLVNEGDLIMGAENKTAKTPITTAQRIRAILGRYRSFTLSFLKTILTKVEIATMRRNKSIPTIGPIATKTTERAAGRKIPKPLIPMIFLVTAITKAEIGRSSKSTIVFAGTPAPTAPLMAYLTGLKRADPKTCSLRSFSKGPKVWGIFWVKSGTITGVDVGTSVGVANGLGEGLTLTAKDNPGLKRVARKKANTAKDKISSLRIGISY